MSVITEDTWDAVMCPACQWNAHDLTGLPWPTSSPPRWCPECERHGQGRPALVRVTITTRERP
jgi:hypothetical protein